MKAHVIDFVFLAGWLAFWIYWLVEAVRTRSAHNWSSRFLGVRVVAGVLIILAIRSPLLRGHAGTIDNPLQQGIGLAFFLLGLAVAVWARVYLGRNWGMPMTERTDPELVTTGPYRYIRHPIYSGLILAMLGTAIALSFYGLIVVAVMGGYFIFSATAEERTMAARFPATYPAYKASTKMLIPLVL